MSWGFVKLVYWCYLWFQSVSERLEFQYYFCGISMRRWKIQISGIKFELSNEIRILAFKLSSTLKIIYSLIFKYYNQIICREATPYLPCNFRWMRELWLPSAVLDRLFLFGDSEPTVRFTLRREDNRSCRLLSDGALLMSDSGHWHIDRYTWLSNEAVTTSTWDGPDNWLWSSLIL